MTPEATLEARAVSEAAIARFAPGELPLFDAIWSDLSASPDEAEVRGQPHALGGEVVAALLSTVIIPLVVSLCSHLVERRVDAILDRITSARTPLPPGVTAEAIAEHLYELLKSEERLRQSR